MKAILCMDKTVNEITNWFNFEDCRKFVLSNFPKNSTVIVDDKTFVAMEKLNLTKNLKMVVFNTKSNFEKAKICNDFLTLKQIVEENEKKKLKTFVIANSNTTEELLPFCNMMTVGKFNKKIKNLPIAPSPEGGKRWICVSKLENKESEFLTFVNIHTIQSIMMPVKDALRKEDLLQQETKDEPKKENKTKKAPTATPKTPHVPSPKNDVKTEQIMNRVTSRPSAKITTDSKTFKSAAKDADMAKGSN